MRRCGARRRVAGMRYFLLIFAVVGQSVLAADDKPLIADPIVEKAVRKSLKKPEGKLTKADLAKVTELYLYRTKTTDAGLEEVAKLQQLEELWLHNTKITDVGLKDVDKLQQLTNLFLTNTKVTKAGVAELQKALPKCIIESNPTK